MFQNDDEKHDFIVRTSHLTEKIKLLKKARYKYLVSIMHDVIWPSNCTFRCYAMKLDLMFYFNWHIRNCLPPVPSPRVKSPPVKKKKKMTNKKC